MRYIFIVVFFMIFISCSNNFYPVNYNGKKKGFVYYEVKTDSCNIPKIYKIRKNIFSKKDKLKKIIEINNKQGNIYIYPEGVSRVIIYDKQGNKSKGAYYKDGRIILMFPNL